MLDVMSLRSGTSLNPRYGWQACQPVDPERKEYERAGVKSHEWSTRDEKKAAIELFGTGLSLEW